MNKLKVTKFPKVKHKKNVATLGAFCHEKGCKTPNCCPRSCDCNNPELNATTAIIWEAMSLVDCIPEWCGQANYNIKEWNRSIDDGTINSAEEIYAFYEDQFSYELEEMNDIYTQLEFIVRVLGYHQNTYRKEKDIIGDWFCRFRSYLQEMHKVQNNIFRTLVEINAIGDRSVLMDKIETLLNKAMDDAEEIIYDK
jgi:hypothetical protein